MRILWSIFPKFYRHLDLRGLAALAREVAYLRRVVAEVEKEPGRA